MIYQGNKRRWCGYCGKYIDGFYIDFDKHLNYCELRLASYLADRRKGDDDGQQLEKT